MSDQEEQQAQGKRVGVHPLFVIFGVIFGLWLFITLIIPNPKDQKQRAGMPTKPVQSNILDTITSDMVPTFKESARVPEMNAINLIVPPETTDSQILALIKKLQTARVTGTLATILPPTTPGHELGDFSIADVYIFSEEPYAIADSARALGRGAHAPGEFYPSSIPFEVAMEHVRGHYSINLHNRTNPETASLGFGEASTGVYSKQYQPLSF